MEEAVTALEKISPKLKVFQLQTGYKCGWCATSPHVWLTTC
jgi:hypothetical protein